MTVTVTADMVMSLDGYIAGTDHSVANPAGNGADRIGGWIHAQSSWRKRSGLDGGEADRDSEIMREWFEATGSVVMGRLMYDSGVEFWEDNPPFRTPVFVLTNRPAPALVKEGGTSFTFVTDGIHSALDQAKAAACGRNVDIAGGADTVQQYLRARLVDELQRPRTDPRGGHPRRPGWVRETLAILGMDPAPGTPVADLARVYVNAVEGTSNGSTFTPPATPSQPSR